MITPFRGGTFPGLSGPRKFLAFLFFFAGGLGFSQEGSAPVRAISPNEAVELALKNNLGLESARVSLGTKKRKSDHSWNALVPSLTLGGSLIMDNKASSYTGYLSGDSSTLGNPLMPGQTYDSITPFSAAGPRWHIGASIQANFTLSFALFEGMKNLRLQYEGGLLSYDTAKAQLEREVRKSYYQMLLLQEQIELLRESFDTAGRQAAMAEANYRAGLSPELTLLQAQVSRENLKPQIDQAENGLRIAMANFAMNLGLPFDTAFELLPVEGDTSFVTLDVKDLISRAAQSRPDIMELRQNILVLESGRRAQKLQVYTPTLSLSWGSTPYFTRDPWKDNWFKGDNWTSSGSLTLGLGFRLHSLLPFGPDLQGVKDQDDALKSLHIGLAQAIRGTELEIYNTVLSLDKARASVEAQSLTVEMAEKSYRLTEEAYRAGLQEFLQVQNAELSLRQARVGVLEQNFAYLQGLIDLEYALGVPFGTLGAGN